MSAESSRFSAWQAGLSLNYRSTGQRTVLAERRHYGPLHVQKPFYPEGDVCHTYILHPPGGVAGGDQLTINVAVENGAHALVTTPASNKFYRSISDSSIVRQTINVDDNAIVEWLPQDSIMFSGCRVDTRTRINLKQGASFIGWEITCLGRPASGEKFSQGECRQKIDIFRNDRPLHIESALFKGDGEILNAKWGLAAHTVSGLMLVSNADKDLLELVRASAPGKRLMAAATLKGELLLVRCLGHQNMDVHKYFSRLWSLLRPQLMKREASIPRIWHT